MGVEAVAGRRAAGRDAVICPGSVGVVDTRLGSGCATTGVGVLVGAGDGSWNSAALQEAATSRIRRKGKVLKSVDLRIIPDLYFYLWMAEL